MALFWAKQGKSTVFHIKTRLYMSAPVALTDITDTTDISFPPLQSGKK